MVDLNQVDLKTIEELSLAELKSQSPSNLLKLAEKIEIDNASTMRKGDMMFAILKEMAEEGVEIYGDGVLEVVQDGFGFLRSHPSRNVGISFLRAGQFCLQRP